MIIIVAWLSFNGSRLSICREYQVEQPEKSTHAHTHIIRMDLPRIPRVIVISFVQLLANRNTEKSN